MNIVHVSSLSQKFTAALELLIKLHMCVMSLCV